MKKLIIAGIIGVAATASTFAQGKVVFNNFDGIGLDAPVHYGAGTDGTLGDGLLETYTAGLYYAFGTVGWTDGTGIADPAANGFTLNPITVAFTAGDPGYFDASPTLASITGYTSGNITFVVVAYEGANYNSAIYRGHSAPFTLSSIATGQTPADGFGANVVGTGFQSFNVLPVPEPSTFALAGLGLASLVIFRRRN
jgi:hypothetical protein